MQPKFTIITPTLARSTLSRLCDSIDQQGYANWEHLVGVDLPDVLLTEERKERLLEVMRGNRRIIMMNQHTGSYGHRVRHELSQPFGYANGEYFFYLDDDDYLGDSQVLETLSHVTSKWAIFPVLREGHRFFDPHPGRCRTTLSSFIHHTTLGPFPASTDYEADGVFIEQLARGYPDFEVLDMLRPLVVIPKPHAGIGEVEL